MIFLSSKDGKGRLGIPINVYGKILGQQDGHLSVHIFFYQMEQKIPVGIGTAAGIDPRLLGDDTSIQHLHQRKLHSKPIDKSPMRRATLSVQHSSGGKKKSSHT